MPAKVSIVKDMVFPVVTHGCESWTIEKAEHLKIDAFVKLLELGGGGQVSKARGVGSLVWRILV